MKLSPHGDKRLQNAIQKEFQRTKDEEELNRLRRNEKKFKPYMILFYIVPVLALGSTLIYKNNEIKRVLGHQPTLNEYKRAVSRAYSSVVHNKNTTTSYGVKKRISDQELTKQLENKISAPLQPPVNSPKAAIQKNDNNADKIYYWTDNNGNIHANNTGLHPDKEYLNSIKEVNPYNKRTKIRIAGNSIYIPVTFSNNGKTVTTEMLLDTGCATTVINSRIAKHLGLKKHKIAYSILADGRKVANYKTKIKSIKVGPHNETAFTLKYRKNVGVGDSAGLLGMNFLKSHPFVIDTRNNMIVWE